MKKYNQLCVLQGTLEPDSKKEFNKFFKENFGVRVKYAEQTHTLPDPGVKGTGGRSDLLFFIHDDDIQKFAIPRFKMGIRWWEDVFTIKCNTFTTKKF